MCSATETKWVSPAEADITSGRRDWLGGTEEEETQVGIVTKVKRVLVG